MLFRMGYHDEANNMGDSSLYKGVWGGFHTLLVDEVDEVGEFCP